MNPIIMRLDLSEADRYAVELYESSQTAEQLRISGSRNLDLNNIDGNLINTLDYPEVHDLYEDAAAYHATRAALQHMGIRVGFYRHSSLKTEGIAVMGVYSAPIQKPKDMEQSDFFDLLRELDETIVKLATLLREEEASVRNVHLTMARAAAEAMHSYLDIDFEEESEIPSGPAIDLQNRLKDLDALKLSEEGLRWVKNVKGWLAFLTDYLPPM
ncbi:hypothetical protein IWQ54_000198 [Labrenzia sp. EL_195]|nr:hypothetical protein [Labrenzia sp. EL_195]